MKKSTKEQEIKSKPKFRLNDKSKENKENKDIKDFVEDKEIISSCSQVKTEKNFELNIESKENQVKSDNIIFSKTSKELNLINRIKSSSELMQKKNYDNIKVFVRFRPLNEVEECLLEKGLGKICINYINPINNNEHNFKTVQIDDNTRKFLAPFSYDGVFDPQINQEFVYNKIGKDIVQDVLCGYNGTVFAYGQSGSGKTHTMYGPDIFDEEKMGIIPRLVKDLFEEVEKNSENITYEFIMSCCQIYKENIMDLLSNETNLKIKEHPTKGIFIDKLTKVSIDSFDTFMNYVSICQENRIVGETKLNQTSSRSHCILILEVCQTFENSKYKKHGILNLVDLAGSEKISKTGAIGETLEEAKKINLSLSALGNVIHALTTNAEHIPYRDSKLTRILQESLGGNFKTSIVVTCSPFSYQYDEILSSLQFAQRAKKIKNNVKINIELGYDELKSMVDILNNKLCNANIEINYLKKILRENNIQYDENTIKKDFIDIEKIYIGSDKDLTSILKSNKNESTIETNKENILLLNELKLKIKHLEDEINQKNNIIKNTVKENELKVNINNNNYNNIEESTKNNLLKSINETYIDIKAKLEDIKNNDLKEIERTKYNIKEVGNNIQFKEFYNDFINVFETNKNFDLSKMEKSLQNINKEYIENIKNLYINNDNNNNDNNNDNDNNKDSNKENNNSNNVNDGKNSNLIYDLIYTFYSYINMFTNNITLNKENENFKKINEILNESLNRSLKLNEELFNLCEDNQINKIFQYPCSFIGKSFLNTNNNQEKLLYLYKKLNPNVKSFVSKKGIEIQKNYIKSLKFEENKINQTNSNNLFISTSVHESLDEDSGKNNNNNNINDKEDEASSSLIINSCSYYKNPTYSKININDNDKFSSTKLLDKTLNKTDYKIKEGNTIIDSSTSPQQNKYNTFFNINNKDNQKSSRKESYDLIKQKLDSLNQYIIDLYSFKELYDKSTIDIQNKFLEIINELKSNFNKKDIVKTKININCKEENVNDNDNDNDNDKSKIYSDSQSILSQLSCRVIYDKNKNINYEGYDQYNLFDKVIDQCKEKQGIIETGDKYALNTKSFNLDKEKIIVNGNIYYFETVSEGNKNKETPNKNERCLQIPKTKTFCYSENNELKSLKDLALKGNVVTKPIKINKDQRTSSRDKSFHYNNNFVYSISNINDESIKEKNENNKDENENSKNKIESSKDINENKAEKTNNEIEKINLSCPSVDDEFINKTMPIPNSIPKPKKDKDSQKSTKAMKTNKK